MQTLWQDLVLPITQVTIGTREPAYNRTWYQLNGEGYVHSGSIQPVEINLNKPVTSIPEKGLLAEITVPLYRRGMEPAIQEIVRPPFVLFDHSLDSGCIAGCRGTNLV